MSENDYPANDGQPDDTVDLTEDDKAVRDAIASASEPGGLRVDEPAAAPASDSEKEAELNDLKERFLRLAAELENTRRRGEREKSDAGRYAIANFARDLLGVADNFERALHHAGGDDAPTSKEALSGIVSGLRMTEKELLSVLERHGIKRIAPAGEKFDPNLHQAVAQVPNATIPSGHVVDVAQPGFTIGDRVLRAAMVTVSSGGAGAPKTPDSPQESAPGSNTGGGHIDTKV